MSEMIQPEDPEPLPAHFDYPINLQSGLAFDDYDLAADLLEREQIYLEHEALVRLSNHASRLLDSKWGKGLQTSRKITSGNSVLQRKITDNSWLFSFTDNLTGQSRCRAWTLGGDSVSWCEDENRYESASEVKARLREVFGPVEVLDASRETTISVREGLSRAQKIAQSALRSLQSAILR